MASDVVPVPVVPNYHQLKAGVLGTSRVRMCQNQVLQAWVDLVCWKLQTLSNSLAR